MCEVKLNEVKVEENAFLAQPAPGADSHGITCQDISEHTDHRKLAICSIICGISCFGIMSLMYSVKARETKKRLKNEDSPETREMFKKYSEKACKWGIGSIVAWVVLILIFPLLLGFLSYVVTFIDWQWRRFLQFSEQRKQMNCRSAETDSFSACIGHCIQTIQEVTYWQ